MTAKKKNLRAVLVGTAGRAAWVLDHAKPENGFKLVGLVDVVPENLRIAREKTGLPEEVCFDDARAAIAALELDCMIICTPTKFHVPLTMLGVDAGLAVLTEKGMAPNWESAVQLVNHVKDRDGVVCVAQNYRYSGVSRMISGCLRGEVEGADPGLITCVDYMQHRVRPEPRTLNYPFASVWDMSCHHFDSLICWLGKPHALTGHAFRATWSAYEFPNNTSAFIEFENGAKVNYFHGHDSARAMQQLCIHGENGALLHRAKIQAGGTQIPEGLEYSARPREQFGNKPVRHVEIPGGVISEVGVLEAFHRYVCEGVEPGISARWNLEVMALCHMLALSATQGRRIERGELD